jgi:hypothetical protein
MAYQTHTERHRGEGHVAIPRVVAASVQHEQRDAQHEGMPR